MNDLRTWLIERICRLPEEHLSHVKRTLDTLDHNANAVRSLDAEAASVGSRRTGHPDWPHAPTHQLSDAGTFIVTAATRNKEHFFRGADRLSLLENELLRLARLYGLALEAWAIFSNHYHFVAHTTTADNPLGRLISHLHTSTATLLNEIDGMPGRNVWFNYWDTRLTFEKSYLARLNYVHQNPVRHCLVARATDYPWCSASWFERCATTAQVRTIYSFKIDREDIDDDYTPVM